MIELYTDGSFKELNDKLPNAVCAGTGIVIRYFDNQYSTEVVSEEYYAYRYSINDLKSKINDDIGLFSCFDDINSSLIECIGLSEGINLLRDYLIDNPHEKLRIFVDDSFLKKMVKTYIQLIHEGKNITSSKYYGSVLCMLHYLFMGDTSLLKRINILHVRGHTTNKFNNMADYLACYRGKAYDRVINLMIKNVEFESTSDKKQYYIFLQQLRDEIKVKK